MASNTGCRFDGDEAITFSTSAVAVCRASASLVSLNSRVFWIAMTAWSAKVLRRVSSLSENGLGGCRITAIDPMPPSSVSIGAHAIETSPIAPLSRSIVEGKSGVVAVFGIWRTVRLRMTIPVAVCSTGLGRVRITPSTAAPRQAPTCV